MREVTELDRYLFDKDGYIVVRNALTTEEIAELNRLVDEHTPAPTPERPDQVATHLYKLAQPFRDLIDHPSILPYLLEWIGPSLRMDDLAHSLLSIASPKSSGGGLHMGGTPYQPMAYYHYNNGQIHIGLTVVLWALADVPPGKDGGFCCIPGSHKSNFAMPALLENFEDPHECIVGVPMKAGEALIFTEALTHSRFPWRYPFMRRCLFYRYTPGVMAFEQPHYRPYEEELLQALTPRQRQMFEPPYGRAVNYMGTGKKVGRGHIAADGSVVEYSDPD